MKKFKIGVFGAGRGTDIAKNFLMLGCDVVALCDSHPNRQKAGAARTVSGIKLYDNFDEFIEHDMDAVIIANNFPEHTPYVIKCFEKNLHVFCECISNGTMGEGVELIRAFEKSKSIFMLAENYPQMIFNREIKRVVDGGTLGKILYAEGEYNHPMDFDSDWAPSIRPFPEHWRNHNPASYYITHSLVPFSQ